MRPGWLAVVVFAPLVTGCRSPTQITFAITTDVACSELTDTAFTSGPLAALSDNRPSTAVAHGCASIGTIGSVVVVPSGSDTDLVAARIVTGVGVEPGQCGASSKCIVAKRVLRFIPNAPLVVKVDMSMRCEGISCAGDQTCEEGQCVSAVIGNPSECEGAGCGGDVLAPADGGAPLVDGGMDATLPPDGSIDATVPVEASTDAGDAGDAGDASEAGQCSGACTIDASQCTSAASVQTCEAEASGCPMWGPATTCTTPLGFEPYVCERYGAPSCEEPDWAEWPMPNDSADPSAPNQASLTDNADGTVTDRVTGLMWQQTPAPIPEDAGPDGGFDPSDGAAYCNGLTFAGHADWRVPSMIELVSILDLSASPPINVTYFPEVPQHAFLSSTALHGTDGAWVLDFDTGYTAGTQSGGANSLRCVR